MREPEDSRGSLKRNGRARRRQDGDTGVEAREPEDSRGSLKQEREGSEAPGRGYGREDAGAGRQPGFTQIGTGGRGGTRTGIRGNGIRGMECEKQSASERKGNR